LFAEIAELLIVIEGTYEEPEQNLLIRQREGLSSIPETDASIGLGAC